jgi:uncharacterized protein (TIGR04255 family)
MPFVRGICTVTPNDLMNQDHLKRVILAIEFTSDLLLTEGSVKQFSEHLKDLFPAPYQTDEKISFEVTMGPNMRSTNEKTEKAFRFTNAADGRTLFVSPRIVTLDLSTYSGFVHFSELVNRVRKALITFGEDATIKTMGLRYINEIRLTEGDPYDWSGWIKQPLTSSVGLAGDDLTISRSMGLMELDDLNYHVRFQYGWFNSQFPNPIALREFVLDYDCQSKDSFAIDTLMQKLDEAHKIIKKIYLLSVDKNLEPK